MRCSRRATSKPGLTELAGLLVKSHERNVSVKGKGGCHQWIASGQCSRGDTCSLNHVSRSSSSISKMLTHTEKCTEPSCDLWHPPLRINHTTESGFKCGRRAACTRWQLYMMTRSNLVRTVHFTRHIFSLIHI